MIDPQTHKMFSSALEVLDTYLDGHLGTCNGDIDAPCDCGYIEPKHVIAGLKHHLEQEPPREPPLLQCPDCHNTESCAGAMARYFNQGRCLHCGGYFKVIRA